jgi:hypothetical protein
MKSASEFNTESTEKKPQRALRVIAEREEIDDGK